MAFNDVSLNMDIVVVFLYDRLEHVVGGGGGEASKEFSRRIIKSMIIGWWRI